MTASHPQTARRRNRRYIVLVVIVVAMAAGWVGFWKYASDRAETIFAQWRVREAGAGRIYDCGSQTVGGFPFRIEVNCADVKIGLTKTQPPLELKTANILAVAQVYQPTLLISEFTGPLTIAEAGKPPGYIANWHFGRSSVRGTPGAPERVAFAFDAPTVSRVSPAEPVASARALATYGRIIEGSVTNRPVIELALNVAQLSVPSVGPLARAPIDIDILGTLRGLQDFAPKPWADRLRELQAAGGRFEIANARLKQGDTVAIGGGSFALNARGRLDGQLNLTVAGVEALINSLTANRQGLGLTLGLGLLGGNATVEGRPAIALPLRIADGTIYFGPLKIGEVPALF